MCLLLYLLVWDGIVTDLLLGCYWLASHVSLIWDGIVTDLLLGCYWLASHVSLMFERQYLRITAVLIMMYFDGF